MRIMTSNIWGDYFGNAVSPRDTQLLEIYKEYSPDIIGFQEVTKNWYFSELFKTLSDDYFSAGAELSGCENYVPFVYKNEFFMLEKGFSRFNETNDRTKGFTWAVLQNGEKKFAVINTHFWWKTGPEHDELRIKNAQQLSEQMIFLNRRYNCPVFAFGDMNCDRNSEVFDVYKKNGIVHLFDVAEEKYDRSSYHKDPVKGEDGLYHGQKTEDPHTDSIDHIVAYGDGFKIKKYTVIEDQKALDATDHSPVFADIELI